MNQEHSVINIDSDDIRNKNKEVFPPSKKQSANFEAIETSVYSTFIGFIKDLKNLRTIVLKHADLFVIDEYKILASWNKEFVEYKNNFHIPKDFNYNTDDFIECANFIYTNDEIEHLFVIIKSKSSTEGNVFVFILMDPHNLNNVNDITGIYKEYLSIGPNCFQKFQIQNNKLIGVMHSYCHVYNIFDKESKFSYKHLKSFSSVFLYIREALKKLLGKNIQTLTPEKYEVSTKNGTLKTESEYEGSIKWIVNYINTVNPHLQFEAKSHAKVEAKSDSKLEPKSDAKEVNINDIISYDFLRNKDLLLITKDGVYIYSLDMHGKIHERFNSKFFIDNVDEKMEIEEKKEIINKFIKFDLSNVDLNKLELYLDIFKYILDDTLILAEYIETEENEKQSLNRISIYKYIKTLLKKRKTQSTINLTVPFPNICVYSEEYSFWKELLYKPNASLFIKMEVPQLYSSYPVSVEQVTQKINEIDNDQDPEKPFISDKLREILNIRKPIKGEDLYQKIENLDKKIVSILNEIQNLSQHTS
ncbi:7632_t:CDS:2 [Racocetra fulgida]|uniref:7632_t:CDS:1 n=1 Tax=Racocetra fulgida TaxID=60492 RepID=A0A9N8VNM0_9GLOM|nr:7632_t:CDS:2 [Racocetra fulgida]